MSQTLTQPFTVNGREITAEFLAGANLATIAYVISKAWRPVYFGAVPYLQAMATLSDVSDQYGMDSGKSIVSYFLANATTWRGDVARLVKAELKRRIKAR